MSQSEAHFLSPSALQNLLASAAKSQDLGGEISHSTSAQPSFSALQLNPLHLNWQEQASLVARVGLDKKQEYLGVPQQDDDSQWTYPIFSKNGGDVIGGLSISRKSDGTLSGEFARILPHFKEEHSLVPPTFSGTTFKTGDYKENKAGDEKGWLPDNEKWSKPSFEAGGKEEVSASLVDISTGSFSIDPNGSGWGKNTGFAAIKGTLGGQGTASAGWGEKGIEAGVGGEASAEFRAASANTNIQYFGPVKPGATEGTCDQLTATGELEAYLGAGAKASGQLGTQGVAGKLSAGLGGGAGIGGSFNPGKDVECIVERKIIGGETPYSSTTPEPSLIEQYSQKFQSQLQTTQSTDPSALLTASRIAPAAADEAPPLTSYLHPAGGGGLFDGPTYGNWGGGGWSGGVRDNTPVCRADWLPPANKMDEAFREHDYNYMRNGIDADTPQSNPFKQEADKLLLQRLDDIPNSELGTDSIIFKDVVKVYFGAKTSYQDVSDDVAKAYADARKNIEDAAAYLGNKADEGGRWVEKEADELDDWTSKKAQELDDGIDDAADYLGNKADDFEGWVSEKTKALEDGVSSLMDFGVSNDGSSPSDSMPLGDAGGDSLASADGKSITAIETEAEAIDQATEGHAKRAESAAQRAVAAAHRAASARAQMQALLSGI